ncbi:GNAT family N-acetyltransferase [Rhizobium miluonense]|uniref:Acetyltransferase (GNAT) family protein n=1 Tax=Rhizobium miluonense TaxID=411945 RepID=A0A1C3UJD1_9HYPH|nr:GNAT family N-acetyltransferase [Rhizobium miluonense]SCB15565.1 Acetyltransferase (GNAT) family protein [Rhizobium miluonense]
MVSIRTVRLEDIDQLYAISLSTGDAGKDAAPLHRDGRLIGHIYSAPYATLHPELVFVAEDEEGVFGYIAGVFDTIAFDERLEREWWPHLRGLYADPEGDPALWDADQKRISAIHHPKQAPAILIEQFPAHIHMNLLPRAQGKGVGTALLDRWMENARLGGIKGIHLGANSGNHSGIRFWSSRGFVPVELPPGLASETTVWFGQFL